MWAGWCLVTNRMTTLASTRMAPNSGIGIGIDRLAMIVLGRDNIRDVILFPALREKD